MNSTQYSTLESLILRYSKLLPPSPFDANTFLSVIKPTPENLKKYKPIFESRLTKVSSNKLLPTLIHKSLLVAYVSFMSMAHLIISTLTPFEWVKNELMTIPRNVDHFILQIFPNLDKERQLNSTFPDRLKYLKSNHTTMQVVLNGSRIPHLFLRRLLQKNDISYVIVPKTLNPIATFHILLTNFISILKLLKNPAKNDIEERIFVRELIKNQFSRATFTNQILKHYLLQMTKNVHNLKSTLLTVEGHAHEKIWIETVKSVSYRTQINLYQHAPILTNQLSFFKNIDLLRSTDIVHFSGKFPQTLVSEWFKKQNRIINPLFLICGSDKFLEARSGGSKSRSSVLFLPEGTIYATRELLQLFQELKNIRPDLHIIFRLHPSLAKSNKLRNFVNVKKHVSEQFSSSSLTSDLSESICSIYRGSASAIQGLSLGVFPIYFSNQMSVPLDPIPQKIIKHPVCDNAEQVSLAIDELLCGQLQIDAGLHSLMADFSRNYFVNPKLNSTFQS